MTLGPVEILVLSFPEGNFTGAILPELARRVADGTITIIDGVFVRMDEEGIGHYVEFSEVGSNDEVAELTSLIDRVEGLVSDDDVAQLTEGLPANSSAAILVFEHTWMKPLRDAVVDAGGVLLESVRVPGTAVDEVLAALSTLDSSPTS